MIEHCLPKRALLIGNGLNRIYQGRTVDISWKSMIMKLEGEFTEMTEFSERGELLPTLFRMQRAANLQGDNDSTLKEWIKTLDELGTCKLHNILAKQAALFPAIITTNYDHVLEKALGIDCQVEAFDGKWGNLYRCQKNDKLAVYHPHGEVGCPGSVLYSLKYYMKEISRLIQFDVSKRLNEFNGENPTWMDWFIHSELHICGLEFGYDELTLWHALQKRFDIKGENNDAFIYLFFDAGKSAWKKEAEARESLFNSFGVECVCIPVYENNYERAWMELLGTMLIKLENSDHGQVGNTGPMLPSSPNDPPQSAKSPVEQEPLTNPPAALSGIPEFRNAWRGYNVTATAKATDNNPRRCWLNIGVERLLSVVKSDAYWIFDCLIDGNRYCYRANARSLQNSLDRVNKLDNPERYSFYIEYRTGKLFRTVGDIDTIMCLDVLPLDAFKDTLCRIPRI